MNEIQDKLINALKSEINNRGLEALLVYSYSNIGKISVQKKAELFERARINFDFQQEYSTFSIFVNEKPVLSQPGKENYYDFRIVHSDKSAYEYFIRLLREALSKALQPITL